MYYNTEQLEREKENIKGRMTEIVNQAVSQAVHSLAAVILAEIMEDDNASRGEGEPENFYNYSDVAAEITAAASYEMEHRGLSRLTDEKTVDRVYTLAEEIAVDVANDVLKYINEEGSAKK